MVIIVNCNYNNNKFKSYSKELYIVVYGHKFLRKRCSNG